MKKRMILLFISFTFIVVIFYHQTDKIMKRSIRYNGNQLMVSVDGVDSNTLPVDGDYYLVSYDCKAKDTLVSWDRTSYQLEVSNQNKKGGVACYLDFQSSPHLSNMPEGSYVSYVGNNGCAGKTCFGQNANYVSDSSMGYCGNSSYQYKTNGWRIAYIKDGSVYLVSAGSTDCLCTDSNGTSSGSNCSSSVGAGSMNLHLKALNQAALKYCNKDYAYNGVCDTSSAWAMTSSDFQNIVGTSLSSSSCYSKSSDKSCGYGNDLIDNGGYYWFASAYETPSTGSLIWQPNYRRISQMNSNFVLGVRPVLRLDSNVIVKGGSGTYEDPYQILNNSFSVGQISSLSEKNSSSVTLNMMGYNVKQMCINLNSSGCSNYIDFHETYTLDLSNAVTGVNIIYVYYKDSSGKIIATMNRSFTLS